MGIRTTQNELINEKSARNIMQYSFIQDSFICELFFFGFQSD